MSLTFGVCFPLRFIVLQTPPAFLPLSPMVDGGQKQLKPGISHCTEAVSTAKWAETPAVCRAYAASSQCVWCLAITENHSSLQLRWADSGTVIIRFLPVSLFPSSLWPSQISRFFLRLFFHSAVQCTSVSNAFVTVPHHTLLQQPRPQHSDQMVLISIKHKGSRLLGHNDAVICHLIQQSHHQLCLDTKVCFFWPMQINSFY